MILYIAGAIGFEVDLFAGFCMQTNPSLLKCSSRVLTVARIFSLMKWFRNATGYASMWTHHQRPHSTGVCRMYGSLDHSHIHDSCQGPPVHQGSPLQPKTLFHDAADGECPRTSLGLVLDSWITLFNRCPTMDVQGA